MKRTILTAAVLLIPTALFAEVQININTGVTVAAQASCDDEPWFEGIQHNGDAEVSFEYSWNSDNGQRVLQYRQVSFIPVTGAWAFGPWMIRRGFCHSSCHLHHAHNFYHRSYNAPQWSRVYSHRDHYNRPQYRYECRDEHYARRAPVQVTRHDYYPPMHREYNAQPQRRYERTVERHYITDEQNRVTDERNRNRVLDERNRVLDERNRIMAERNRIEQSRNNNRNDNQPIVRVTERERNR